MENQLSYSACSLYVQIMDKQQHVLNSFRTATVAEAVQINHKRSGIATSVLLYTTAPQRAKFVQAVNGVNMWRQGCSEKMFNSMCGDGVSQTLPSARGHVDNLRRGHNKQVKEWKQKIEVIIIPFKTRREEIICFC